jgi:hypothetical protein
MPDDREKGYTKNGPETPADKFFGLPRCHCRKVAARFGV